MKAVLISIQPKWCELIASGKKTVEVRKTKPKLETPFKVYIYCTKGDSLNYLKRPFFDNYQKFWVDNNAFGSNVARANGKVIGEFVCDEIYTINKDSCGWFYGKDNEVMGIRYAEAYKELAYDLMQIPRSTVFKKEIKNLLNERVGEDK